ncbi:DEAD/DEAH box helicase [Phragmitibacter flavus]|uniref:DEAD/DEAH box helicase n=1 Tax=Phragmitibacter flavus TaxID=2576071 RepID=A0A5R8KJM7_9BACT|nr:DEAD/DEAH box helicase [Phragmitibacter flavus]TLD72457.1 DEAD/DEAH box helicase [Phragmitibacter flavus]
MVTYAGCPDRLSITVRASDHEWTADGILHRLERDTEAERTLLRQLHHLGLQPFMEAHPGTLTTAPLNPLALPPNYETEFWPQLLQTERPNLKTRGWTIHPTPDFGHDIIQLEDHHFHTQLKPEPGTDYDLQIGLHINEHRLSLIPIIADAVHKGLTVQEVAESPPDTPFLFFIPELGDRLISLPQQRLLPILSILHELSSPATRRKKHLRIDRLRAAQLSTQKGLALQLPAELAQLAQRLNTQTTLPDLQPPTTLKATLRPYQLEGLRWLQFLRELNLHGILADDMGLGKTIQTIAHILTEVESGRATQPTLILAPTSLLRNWVNEAKKFAPSLRTLTLHGDHRRERYPYIRQSHLVVTSYPLLIRDIEKLKTYDWHLVVLDEAHNIKNARAKAAQAARALNARHRLCLTGTPMENHLGELWSLFHFLMPGYLGEQDTFRTFFRNPIEKKNDPHAQTRLSARLQPVLLRRTKDTVAKDLPAKTEIINPIDLDKSQADLYETIRAAVDKRVQAAIADQGLEKSQLIVLEALLKLRQVCCHPQLLNLETTNTHTTSAKTEFLLDELLPELIEENRRILIFSQFTSMLAILEAELKTRNHRYVKLTGQTQDRETPVNQFQTGKIPLFLISLKAGGVGLNLTAADTVIHYDPWWNPAVEAQATDRAHRIGQTKPVFVHKLICQGTIEERIVEMQNRKSTLITNLLTGRTDNLKLTQEDIRELLSPP